MQNTGPELDLYMTAEDLTMEDLPMEELPEGNALGSFSTSTSASTASCPGSSAASLSTASCVS